MRRNDLNYGWSRKIMPLSNLKVVSHALKTYSRSRIELQNMQILKKINAGRVKSVFVIRAALWAEKGDIALKIAGVKKIHSENVCLWSTLEAIWFELWSTGDSQISLMHCDALSYSWPWPLVSFTSHSEHCALKQTGTFTTESKIVWLFLLINWF